ncbi:helix-turn-helix domain-containing protein [Actinocorallia longicatena]|uniref:AraC family transcriptional regulator n=1 Tax=Actinocorallia longicatena TaxID=111803 RepID=UPI0031D8C144
MDEPQIGRTRHTASEYGLLNGPSFDFRLDRAEVSPDLAGHVERHWMTSWNLPGGQRRPVTLLPHPCVNLVYEGGALIAFGVGRELFTYACEGTGRAFGVKFRPGGFQPYLGRPMTELTDGGIPLSALWGEIDAGLFAHDLSRARRLDDLVEAAEFHLRRHPPRPDPQIDHVGEIIQVMLHDRTVQRVEDVAERFSLSPRSLQRLFGKYVGVTPKWVLQRYRLHEAAARLAAEHTRPWAEVAVELGYFDQSHFIRDFTRAVGMTPAAYSEACAQDRAPIST